MASLNPKQQRFVEEYLKDLNATAAAGRAGYRHTDIGRQLIAKTHVAAAIQQAQEERSRRTQVTTDRVVLELARVAFADPRKLYNPDGSLKPIAELDDDTAATIGSLEVFEEYEGSGENRRQVGQTKKLKQWPKVDALKTLAQHLDMIGSNKANTGANGNYVEPIRRLIIEVSPPRTPLVLDTRNGQLQ